MCSMMYDPNLTQQIVFGVLLKRHPSIVGADEISAETDVPEGDVEDALTMLCSHGVANRLGGRVGLSGAALRTTQLLG